MALDYGIGSTLPREALTRIKTQFPCANVHSQNAFGHAWIGALGAPHASPNSGPAAKIHVASLLSHDAGNPTTPTPRTTPASRGFVSKSESFINTQLDSMRPSTRHRRKRPRRKAIVQQLGQSRDRQHREKEPRSRPQTTTTIPP